MSRKTKRQVRKEPSTSTVARSTAAPAAGQTARPSVMMGGARSYEREFNPDYTPVIRDLKRIGTLAGTFFVILIILSFFLR